MMATVASWEPEAPPVIGRHEIVDFQVVGPDLGLRVHLEVSIALRLLA